MRRKLVAGNWKMHGTGEALPVIADIASAAAHSDGVDVALCLPATLIDRAARAVPGPPVLRRHPNASIVSMACDQAGNCSGGGNYPDGKTTTVPHGDDPHLQALVVSVRQ